MAFDLMINSMQLFGHNPHPITTNEEETYLSSQKRKGISLEEMFTRHYIHSDVSRMIESQTTY